MQQRLTVFAPLAGCTLVSALEPLIEDGRVILSTQRLGLNIASYTTAEAIQRIRYYRGEIEIPRRLRHYCNIEVDLDPSAVDAASTEDADIVLLEPISPFVISFGPYILHRGTLTSLLNRLQGLGDSVNRAATAWRQALFARDRQAQTEAAQAIIPQLTGPAEDAELTRDLLLETQLHRQDFDEFLAGLGAVCDLLHGPFGLVAYAYQYLPRGRSISWPADFLEHQLEAARRLGLPVFDPAEIVNKHGVAVAMDEGLQLYRAEFVPVLADALFGFCHQVVGGRSGRETPTGVPPTARGAAFGKNFFAEDRSFGSSEWHRARTWVSTERLDDPPPGLVPVKLVEDESAAGGHDIRRYFSGAAEAAAYAASFFARAAERKAAVLWLSGASFGDRAEALFDLRDGSVAMARAEGTGVGSVRAGMIPVANGWWWCWLSAALSFGGDKGMLIALSDGSPNLGYEGDGRSGLWLAGPRIEFGSRPVLDLCEEADAAPAPERPPPRASWWRLRG